MAPRYVILSNLKWFRNLAISQIVADTMDDMDLGLPKPGVGLNESVASTTKPRPKRTQGRGERCGVRGGLLPALCRVRREPRNPSPNDRRDNTAFTLVDQRDVGTQAGFEPPAVDESRRVRRRTGNQ